MYYLHLLFHYYSSQENMSQFSLYQDFGRRQRGMVFALLCLIQIFLNYDSGAIAFLLDLLQVGVVRYLL